MRELHEPHDFTTSALFTRAFSPQSALALSCGLLPGVYKRDCMSSCVSVPCYIVGPRPVRFRALFKGLRPLPTLPNCLEWRTTHGRSRLCRCSSLRPSHRTVSIANLSPGSSFTHGHSRTAPFPDLFSTLVELLLHISHSLPLRRILSSKTLCVSDRLHFDAL